MAPNETIIPAAINTNAEEHRVGNEENEKTDKTTNDDIRPCFKNINVNNMTDDKTVSGDSNLASNGSFSPGAETLENYINNIKSSNLTLRSNKDVPNKEEQLLDESKTIKQFPPVWRQTLCASASILLTLAAGMTSGYSAILLPQLKAPNSGIPADADTSSWIAAMAALPMAPGCLLSGWMMERFGRKTSHFIVCLPILLGWILIASANNLTLILLGRFFTGVCVGLLGPLGPVYIGECSDPKYRGFFLAGVSLAIAVGILIIHMIGTFISWQITAVISLAFPVLAAVLLMFVPESPTWLISKNRIEDGIKSFGWLRGYGEEANKELKGILEKQKVVAAEPKLMLKQKILNLKSPELLKPLMIMIIFFITCQFSGVNAVAFYSIDIIEKAVGKGINHYVSMLIIDLVRVAMSVVACLVCKRYGRRPLCFISGIWTALSLFGLSLFIYFAGATPGTHLAWIPLSCLMSYICAISVGLVPLPWIMCGEVFPTKVRGLGSGMSSATTFTAFFIVVKTAPGMMHGLGEVATFLIYGSVAFFGTCILYFILPETKGKSLQEIEERFKNNSKNVNSSA